MHRTHQEWTGDSAFGETTAAVFFGQNVELSKDLLSNKNGNMAGWNIHHELKIMNNEDVVSQIAMLGFSWDKDLLFVSLRVQDP